MVCQWLVAQQVAGGNCLQRRFGAKHLQSTRLTFGLKVGSRKHPVDLLGLRRRAVWAGARWWAAVGMGPMGDDSVVPAAD